MTEIKNEHTWIAIGESLPDIKNAVTFAGRTDCGAINMFIGATRNHEKDRVVRTLFYDCYIKMALSELQKIADNIRTSYTSGGIVIWHRIGEVPVGEHSLVVVISSAHRNEAFTATAELVDRLKQNVPIWKKEHFEEGSLWKEEQKLNLTDSRLRK